MNSLLVTRMIVRFLLPQTFVSIVWLNFKLPAWFDMLYVKVFWNFVGLKSKAVHHRSSAQGPRNLATPLPGCLLAQWVKSVRNNLAKGRVVVAHQALHTSTYNLPICHHPHIPLSPSKVSVSDAVIFLPRDANLASAEYACVCPSVRHKPVLYRNDWTNRAGFFGNQVSSTYLALCYKEIRV